MTLTWVTLPPHPINTLHDVHLSLSRASRSLTSSTHRRHCRRRRSETNRCRSREIRCSMLFSRVISRKFHSMANQRAKSNRTFLDARRRLSRHASRHFLLFNLVKSTDCANCSLRITCVLRRVRKTSIPRMFLAGSRAIGRFSSFRGGFETIEIRYDA